MGLHGPMAGGTRRPVGPGCRPCTVGVEEDSHPQPYTKSAAGTLSTVAMSARYKHISNLLTSFEA
jgi:hypothetical protein